ncbi:MAG: tetratricopeptide repeat protein [Nevskia sp.]|nr:tetratricopeptide repeat protein [Nevskia sp.]
MSSKLSFFAELQRRHVYKVGAMYCVAGWLLVQVVTQVLPIFDISFPVQRLLVLAVVAGFPVALVLSWLFDITPQGIVRTADVPDGGETPAAIRQRRRADRRLSAMLVATLFAAAVYFGIDKMGLLAAPASATAASAKKSIAVLPFANLSDDKANAYFAEGMQDEILTHLAKVGALKVISRTSTQQYAANPGNLSEIAKQLGASNILEGSVQKSGDAVHVNVQLIEAATDSHLWAETYNRKLNDVFGVEGEVAQTIARTLNAELNGAELAQMAAAPTNHGEAYDAYLHGLSYSLHPDPGGENSAQAIAAFEQAVRLDSGFALAWARLSREHSYIYFYHDASGGHRDAAAAALAQARQLSADLAETRVAEGFYRYWVEKDIRRAKAVFEQVQAQYPNNEDAFFALAAIARRQGRWDEARNLYQHGLDLIRKSFRRTAQN